MTDMKLSITPDFVDKLIASLGTDTRLEMQAWVVKQIAETMIENYKQDTEDRELRSELLDKFCQPADDYWDRNRVVLLANFKSAIQKQVSAGIDNLISERVEELRPTLEKRIADAAKRVEEIVDQAVEKYIDQATAQLIETKVQERLHKIAARLLETQGAVS